MALLEPTELSDRIGRHVSPWCFAVVCQSPARMVTNLCVAYRWPNVRAFSSVWVDPAGELEIDGRLLGKAHNNEELARYLVAELDALETKLAMHGRHEHPGFRAYRWICRAVKACGDTLECVHVPPDTWVMLHDSVKRMVWLRWEDLTIAGPPWLLSPDGRFRLVARRPQRRFPWSPSKPAAVFPVPAPPPHMKGIAPAFRAGEPSYLNSDRYLDTFRRWLKGPFKTPGEPRG